MRDANAEVSDACAYYRKILPFYEKESLSAAHLGFWRALAARLRPRRILEIGSGLGRITAELSRVAPAVGLDVSMEMLAAAPRRDCELLVLADARRPVARPVFDLIVAPGDPFSHMTLLEDRRRALRAVALLLAPGGRFVLEGLYRRRREVALSQRRIPHAEGVLHVDEAWIPIGAGDLWHARYRYRDRGQGRPEKTLSASFLARAWNPATIRPLFASRGLRIEKIWGGFDRRPFRTGASRMIVIARRDR